jgi:hypothetical protein
VACDLPCGVTPSPSHLLNKLWGPRGPKSRPTANSRKRSWRYKRGELWYESRIAVPPAPGNDDDDRRCLYLGEIQCTCRHFSTISLPFLLHTSPVGTIIFSHMWYLGWHTPAWQQFVRLWTPENPKHTQEVISVDKPRNTALIWLWPYESPNAGMNSIPRSTPAHLEI